MNWKYKLRIIISFPFVCIGAMILCIGLCIWGGDKII